MPQCNFGNAPQYEQLQELLSVERMTSYYQASNGNVLGAFKLYEWNMDASAAVMHTSGMVEVVLRNALDRRLSAWHESTRPGTDWLDLQVLDKRARQDIADARQRASRRKKHGGISHGKVVAELSFGFWRYLVASRYLTSLWIPAAQHAFPHGPRDPRHRRIKLEASLKSLHLVRNRAAHHEPIHRRNLSEDLLTSAEVAAWIHPTARDWILSRSTLESIVGSRPAG